MNRKFTHSPTATVRPGVSSELGVERLLTIWRWLADHLDQALALYPEFKAHPNQLPGLLQAFPFAAAEFLAEQDAGGAIVLAQFGNVMQHLALADRSLPLELAIGAYEQALGRLLAQAQPQIWATTLNNLATAYCDRIHGDRTTNLETAIALYGQALENRVAADALGQATPLTGLARAYHLRHQGNRAMNLALAIDCYRQALGLLSPETYPVAWAAVMTGLAAAQGDQMLGVRTDNIEQAIASYKAAIACKPGNL